VCSDRSLNTIWLAVRREIMRLPHRWAAQFLLIVRLMVAMASDCGFSHRYAFNEREAVLRLPAHSACTDGHRLPLVVLIHCFGCVAEFEISKFSDAADRLGFGLVAPEGIGRSFNAPSCCGAAKEGQVDDVLLVDRLVENLLSASPQRFLDSAVFVGGFSNGGFMSSYLVSSGVSRTSWAGMAALAGHEYATTRTMPLPVTLHHCRSDEKVSMSGCCMLPSGTSNCCCGIASGHCVSTHSLYHRWLEVNRCHTSVRANASVGGAGGSADCRVGVGCAVETTLCVHDHCTHTDWARRFTAAEDVLAFFWRQACARHGGGALGAVCRCAKGRWGAHCANGQHTKGHAGQHSSRALAARGSRVRGRVRRAGAAGVHTEP
jgi:poly(3-hydroxybutyrate) depolymerase